MAFYDDPLAILSGAGTLGNLGQTIYSAIAKQQEQSRLNSLLKQGPQTQNYYQPMSAAEAAGFGRGVMQNYQGAVPPGGYLDSIMGESMAKRETDRYALAQQMAYNDWVQRIGGRQYAGNNTIGPAQNIGGPLAQYLMLQQVLRAKAAGQQPAGATGDMSQYGQTINPSSYSLTGTGAPGQIPQTPFSLYGGMMSMSPSLDMDLSGYDGSTANRGTGASFN